MLQLHEQYLWWTSKFIAVARRTDPGQEQNDADNRETTNPKQVPHQCYVFTGINKGCITAAGMPSSADWGHDLARGGARRAASAASGQARG